MKDYSHLMGKEVLVCDSKEIVYEGFVVGIDFKIGITIKDINSENDLICMDAKHPYYVLNPDYYKKTFNEMVDFIVVGKWESSKDTTNNPKGEEMSCAFQ